MCDLTCDSDNRQIEREIAIAQGIITRQIWCLTYLEGDWESWPIEIQINFLRMIPRLHLQDYGLGIQ